MTAKSDTNSKAKVVTKPAKKAVKAKPEVVKVVSELDAKSQTAKAGKRSAKAIAQAEVKQIKEERKKSVAATKEIVEKPKTFFKPPRPRAERAGKKYREAIKQIDKTKQYTLAEAVDLAAKTATTKLDSTIRLHVNLAVDPKLADQNIRGSVSLPAGTGKTLRVAVFAEDSDVKTAKAAGADIAGSDELLKLLEKDQLDFDILISPPTMMSRLGKYARLLGPKGLMPNPKSGTVTTDIAKAVKEAKAGRVEYRLDQAGIVHLAIGKASFGPEKLLQNAEAVLASIRAAKPTSVKGVYIKSTYLTSTMGPSIRVAG